MPKEMTAVQRKIVKVLQSKAEDYFKYYKEFDSILYRDASSECTFAIAILKKAWKAK